MGSAQQKAKPRREAASEPGGKRVFKFMSRLCKNSKKKACHSFTHPIKKEKVLTCFWRFAISGASHSNCERRDTDCHELNDMIPLSKHSWAFVKFVSKFHPHH